MVPMIQVGNFQCDFVGVFVEIGSKYYSSHWENFPEFLEYILFTKYYFSYLFPF
jgi:hypothetical protein